MTDFIDIDRTCTEKYNALMSSDLNNEDLVNGLYDLTREDANFLDSYNTLYQIALRDGDFQKSEIMLNRVYEKALKLVMDNKDQWLGSLSWKHENNQHIIRTLFNKALDFWMEEKFGNAREIIGFLNHSNKDQNMGFDFYLLAIKQKIEYEDFITSYLENGQLNAKGKKWLEESFNK